MTAMRCWLPVVVTLAWACASAPHTSEEGEREVTQAQSYLRAEEMVLRCKYGRTVNWASELSEVHWQRQWILGPELAPSAEELDDHVSLLRIFGHEGGTTLGSAMSGPGTPFEYVFTNRRGQEFGDELPELLEPHAPHDESGADAWLAALERFLPPPGARSADGWRVDPAAISSLLRPATRTSERWSASRSGGKANSWGLMTGWLCTPEQWGDARGEIEVAPMDRAELAIDGEEAFRISLYVRSDRDVLADDLSRERVARVGRHTRREVNAYSIGTAFRGTGLLLWNSVEQRLARFAMDGELEVTTRAVGVEGNEELYLRGTYTLSIAPSESSLSASEEAE